MKALSYEEFHRFKHETSTNKNRDVNKINNFIDTIIIEYDEKNDLHLIKNDFKLVFNSYEHRPHLKSSLFDSKIMFPWKSLIKDVINDYFKKGYTFDCIDAINIITIADKRDMTYDFYIKQNMCALERKLNSMINKNKNLFNKLDRNKHHLLITKFYNVPIIN